MVASVKHQCSICNHTWYVAMERNGPSLEYTGGDDAGSCMHGCVGEDGIPLVNIVEEV